MKNESDYSGAEKVFCCERDEVIAASKLREEEQPGDYPVKRYLDDSLIQVTRNGKTERVSFSELTADEQVRHLAAQSREQVEGLCLYLAQTIRTLGSLHHLNHSLKYENALAPMMTELSDALKLVIGDALKGIFLYGSYARGDYDNESDINFLVLVGDEIDDETLLLYRDEVSKTTGSLGLRYDLVISLKYMRENYYSKFNAVNSLIRQIHEEGINVEELLRGQQQKG